MFIEVKGRKIENYELFFTERAVSIFFYLPSVRRTRNLRRRMAGTMVCSPSLMMTRVLHKQHLHVSFYRMATVCEFLRSSFLLFQ